MRAVVVFESMFGTTRTVAYAVADGLSTRYEVTVRPVGDVCAEDLAGIDLLVVGAPTHVRGLSRPRTRQAAAERAHAQPELALEPAATGPGIREWLSTLGPFRVAVFDTRAKAPRVFTGAAGPKIARALRRRGCSLIARPKSFLVIGSNRLAAGETVAAILWGELLAQRSAVTAEPPRPEVTPSGDLGP
jgi:hypothetical protein